MIFGFITNKLISLLCCQSLYFFYHLQSKIKIFDFEKSKSYYISLLESALASNHSSLASSSQLPSPGHCHPRYRETLPQIIPSSSII